MPISDLSLVSTSLQTLLRSNISRLSGSGAPAVLVSLGYPEDQANADRTLNLHLYHVAEDQFNRNLPGPGADPNSTATTPMSLSLFYLMTAHHKSGSRAETEQQIMGHALKTLHDFAMIGPNTSVADAGGVVTTILGGLNDNSIRLEIVLRPLTPEDALAYWASEQQQAVRLAAYYEVRLVQLEPEPVKLQSNIVLKVGQWVGLKTDVAITASRSAMRFERPAALGGSLPEVIEVSPARPFLDHPPINAANFPDTNHFWLEGAGFAGGIRRRLIVRHDSWAGLGVPGGEIALDEAVQPGVLTDIWGVSFQDQRVDVWPANQISYEDSGGSSQTLDILPGTYRARVDVVIGDQAVGTKTRELVRRSNEVLFQIAPRLNVADPPALIPPDRHRVTLRISPRFNLATPRLEVVLVIDGAVYQRVDSFDPVPAKNDGLFRVTATTLVVQPWFDVTEKGLHPVRLSVDGVDAQPFWLETGP